MRMLWPLLVVFGALALSGGCSFADALDPDPLMTKTFDVT
jgi:hypothetical protein